MKILIIEDDKEMALLLKNSLRKEVFSVDCSHDGQKGLFLYQTNHYDMLIVDHNLPLKSGLDLVKEVRAEDPNIKILILTVDNDSETKTAFFEAGADDYLSKPFVFSELTLRIKALLRRPQLTEDNIYKIDDLTVDIDKHLVTRGKKNIYLTFKELMLLEFLMKNKGRVISRAILMENIWDFNADPFSNTIESHILKLRRKLNPKRDKKELIHTIKGRGYKLDTKKW